ncbi:PQQ-dependent sugar dehydrogenase [Solicola sp. PLA-1-18]|uniref:PQQ-dependent sugar dehydrogenase n=1 Tax=Solicola sp. PLA-1-18 TaxID=3380532 RepID=UPI003B7C1FFC
MPTSRTPRRLRRALVATACVALAGPLLASGTSSATTPTAARAAAPRLAATTVASGLSNPWDLAFLDSVNYLVTQRDRGTISLGRLGSSRTRVVARPTDLWASGETGMMAVEARPDFARSREFLTCHGWRKGSKTDVRVVRWRLNAAGTSASIVKTIVRLPITSGRHGGCQLAFTGSGALMIGTGDTARTGIAQKLTSGGGKVLRVNSKTGRGWPTNTWAKSKDAQKRRVYSYGHRNVQGLAVRKGGGVWSVEQGSYRDDEVNKLKKGGNAGWKPGPGYDESAPMTNTSLPRAYRARWSSGPSTIATSGGAWLYGRSWGDRSGKVLAVAALKGEQLRFLRFTAKGRLTSQAVHLKGDFGRLRGVTLGPDQALYVTTSNGSNDKILRVTLR